MNDVLRNENTFNQRASVLKVTILGGMARAALEIEEACATGIYLVAQWETKPYKNCIDQFRFQARSRILGLMDALIEFDKTTAGTDTLSLDFSLPDASAGASSMVGRTRVGAMPVEKAFEAAIPRVVDRQLVLQVARLGRSRGVQGDSRNVSIPTCHRFEGPVPPWSLQNAAYRGHRF